MGDDFLISCPECYVPNQIGSDDLKESINVSLKKPGAGVFEEKSVECSNCNEKYTIYISETLD